MAITYETFLPEVVPYVQDVPEFAAVNAIRSACIDFCEKTLIWQQDMLPTGIAGDFTGYLEGINFTQADIEFLVPEQPLGTFDGQPYYVLPIPTDAVKASVVQIWYNGVKLGATSVDELSKSTLDWRNVKGEPRWFLENHGRLIRVVPMPDKDLTGGLSAIVALAPSRASSSIGCDMVWERWAEVIAYGARSRLYATPGQVYYNMDLALKYAAAFQTGMSKATSEVRQGYGRGTNSVQMRPFV